MDTPVEVTVTMHYKDFCEVIDLLEAIIDVDLCMQGIPPNKERLARAFHAMCEASGKAWEEILKPAGGPTK